MKFQSQQLDAEVEGVSYILETTKTFEGKSYTFKYKFTYDGVKVKDVFALANRDAVTNENNSIKVLDEKDLKNGEANMAKNKLTRAMLERYVKQQIVEVKLADKARKGNVTGDDVIAAASPDELERYMNAIMKRQAELKAK